MRIGAGVSAKIVNDKENEKNCKQHSALDSHCMIIKQLELSSPECVLLPEKIITRVELVSPLPMELV